MAFCDFDYLTYWDYIHGHLAGVFKTPRPVSWWKKYSSPTIKSQLYFNLVWPMKTNCRAPTIYKAFFVDRLSRSSCDIFKTWIIVRHHGEWLEPEQFEIPDVILAIQWFQSAQYRLIEICSLIWSIWWTNRDKLRSTTIPNNWKAFIGEAWCSRTGHRKKTLTLRQFEPNTRNCFLKQACLSKHQSQSNSLKNFLATKGWRKIERKSYNLLMLTGPLRSARK